MKKTILMLFAVAIASANGYAQEPAKEKERKTPEQRAENMSQRLTKELGLNADQEVKAKAIILKREQERDKVAKDMKAEQAKIEAEFKAILTSEQFQKFQNKQEEMKKKREERRKQSSSSNEIGPPQPPAGN